MQALKQQAATNRIRAMSAVAMEFLCTHTQQKCCNSLTLYAIRSCGPDNVLCENQNPAEVQRAKERLSGQQQREVQAQGGSDWPASREPRSLPPSTQLVPPTDVPLPTPLDAPPGSLYDVGLQPEVEKLLLTSGRRLDSFAPEFSAALAGARPSAALQVLCQPLPIISIY